MNCRLSALMKDTRVLNEVATARAASWMHPRPLEPARLLALLVLVMVTQPTSLLAQFEYMTNNGTITITRYTGASGSVVVPDTINGLPVTQIGHYAFQFHFGLTNVTLPGSVTSIEDWAFQSCKGLTSIWIPAGVRSIAHFAFDSCTSLSAMEVDALNPVYGSIDGFLLDWSRTTLIQCPMGKTGAITIPDGITTIGYQAFSNCTNLTRVTIPPSVTTIGYEAFYLCTSLAEITVPTSVTNIEHRAFDTCISLAKVTCHGCSRPR